MARIAKAKKQTLEKEKKAKHQRKSSEESSPPVRKAGRRKETSASKTPKKHEKDLIEIDVFETKPAKKVTKHQKKTNVSTELLISHTHHVDLRYYPEVASLSFPECLEENLLRLVASVEGKCTMQDIMDNVGRFYVTPVQQEMLFRVLRHHEEDGIVLERDGVYALHRDFVPVLVS